MSADELINHRENPDDDFAGLLTVGDYAHQVIQKECHHFFKQTSGVLKDQDPECLHHMRVSSRRLRTAIKVFAPVLQLPKAAQDKQIHSIAKRLGELRDLDVQLSTLSQDYQPRLSEQAQKPFAKVLEILQKHRKSAFKEVENTLSHDRYQTLRATYKKWLAAPQWTPIAQLKLIDLLPDLLTPILVKLLLHPGWCVDLQELSTQSLATLHELRKTCKSARYQAEFFTRFYPEPFKDWIQEIKTLQEALGQVQDTQVLETLLAKYLRAKSAKTELQEILQSDRQQALAVWDNLRQQYLSQSYRYTLHRLILEPNL